jgi:hypothetical protein
MGGRRMRTGAYLNRYVTDPAAAGQKPRSYGQDTCRLLKNWSDHLMCRLATDRYTFSNRLLRGVYRYVAQTFPVDLAGGPVR